MFLSLSRRTSPNSYSNYYGERCRFLHGYQKAGDLLCLKNLTYNLAMYNIKVDVQTSKLAKTIFSSSLSVQVAHQIAVARNGVSPDYMERECNRDGYGQTCPAIFAENEICTTRISIAYSSPSEVFGNSGEVKSAYYGKDE